MDNTDRLQRSAERANRVNVSFYPVGAQGLEAFDSDIGPERPAPPQQDAANLRNRQNGLRLPTSILNDDLFFSSTFGASAAFICAATVTRAIAKITGLIVFQSRWLRSTQLAEARVGPA